MLALRAALSLLGALCALAFDLSRSDISVGYYGQNSYGATNPGDTANYQRNLSYYCTESTIDIFPIAFLNAFESGPSGMPALDLANVCSTTNRPALNGTDLPDCAFLAQDIHTCQAAGRLVTLSLGGASGAASFTGDAQAKAFADTIWNMFLGGKGSVRPFGDAVLDGIDLDIEGGSSTGYAAFVTQLRSHFASANKKYIVTAAPQCPFPDAYLGEVMNSVEFDMIYVQFYNNFCGVQNFDNPNAWNFDQWDTWARTQSPNKDVKIFIGVPGSPSAAGSGYVDPAQLAKIVQQTRANSSSFGGVMSWDSSSLFANSRFDKAIRAALGGGGGAPASSSALSTSSASASAPASTSATSLTSATTSAVSASSASASTGSVPTTSAVAAAAPTLTGAPPFSVIATIPASGAPSSGPSVSTSGSGTATSDLPSSSAAATSAGLSSPTASVPSSTGASAAPTPSGSAGCAAASWNATQVYVGGDSVTYSGHAYSARWWSQADTPSASSDVWQDAGACAQTRHAGRDRMVRRRRAHH